LNSDVQSIISRHDPGQWSRTLAYRKKADLPYDPSRIPRGVSLLFDAVYIDQLKGDLPMPVVDLVASRTILHGAPALAELAVTIGTLKPDDRRTPATLIPIDVGPDQSSAHRCAELPDGLEAAVIAGILARTQSIPP
jgi:hypothetical protein